jgi:hypothetical protein
LAQSGAALFRFPPHLSRKKRDEGNNIDQSQFLKAMRTNKTSSWRQEYKSLYWFEPSRHILFSDAAAVRLHVKCQNTGLENQSLASFCCMHPTTCPQSLWTRSPGIHLIIHQSKHEVTNQHVDVDTLEIQIVLVYFWGIGRFDVSKKLMPEASTGGRFGGRASHLLRDGRIFRVILWERRPMPLSTFVVSRLVFEESSSWAVDDESIPSDYEIWIGSLLQPQRQAGFLPLPVY